MELWLNTHCSIISWFLTSDIGLLFNTRNSGFSKQWQLCCTLLSLVLVLAQKGALDFRCYWKVRNSLFSLSDDLWKKTLHDVYRRFYSERGRRSSNILSVITREITNWAQVLKAQRDSDAKLAAKAFISSIWRIFKFWIGIACAFNFTGGMVCGFRTIYRRVQCISRLIDTWENEGDRRIDYLFFSEE